MSVLACEVRLPGVLLWKLAGVKKWAKISHSALEFIVDEEVDWWRMVNNIPLSLCRTRATLNVCTQRDLSFPNTRIAIDEDSSCPISPRKE